MATLTMNIPDAQVPRLRAAIGKRLGLRDAGNAPRAATVEEVRQYGLDHYRNTVLEEEAATARAAAEAGVTPITPS